jgi:hypothetical protein
MLRVSTADALALMPTARSLHRVDPSAFRNEVRQLLHKLVLQLARELADVQCREDRCGSELARRLFFVNQGARTSDCEEIITK